MPVSARLLDSILLNKLGFTRRDSHHIFYELRIQGQLARRTRISHSARDLSDKLLSAIARQTGVTRQQWLDVIACQKLRSCLHSLPPPPAPPLAGGAGGGGRE